MVAEKEGGSASPHVAKGIRNSHLFGLLPARSWPTPFKFLTSPSPSRAVTHPHHPTGRTEMSYARVNNSSDSEDDTVLNQPHQPQTNGPPREPQRSLTELAAMALPRSHSTYSRLNGEDTDHDEAAAENRRKGSASELDKSKITGDADDDDDDDDASENNDLEINIRFGEGQDLSLRVPRADTIAAMKDKVWICPRDSPTRSAGESYLRRSYF